MFLRLLTAFACSICATGFLNGAPLYDPAAIRDTDTLEVRVLQDWKIHAKDKSIRQKFFVAESSPNPLWPPAT